MAAITQKGQVLSVSAISSLANVHLYIRSITANIPVKGSTVTIKDASNNEIIWKGTSNATNMMMEKEYYYPYLANGIRVTTLAGAGTVLYIQTE